MATACNIRKAAVRFLAVVLSACLLTLSVPFTGVAENSVASSMAIGSFAAQTASGQGEAGEPLDPEGETAAPVGDESEGTDLEIDPEMPEVPETPETPETPEEPEAVPQGDIIPLAAVSVGTYQELVNAIYSATTVDITVTKNIVLENTLWISGRTVSITSAPGVTLSLGNASPFNATPSDSSVGRHFGVNEAGSLTIANLVLDGTGAKGNAGGIYTADGATLSLTNVTVKNCASNAEGGSIRADGSTVTLTNSTITNSASKASAGGGIWAQNTALNLIGATISYATAAQNGGGIWAFGGTTRLGGSLASTVANCTSGGNGGGIGVQNGKVTLDSSPGSSVLDTSAANYGGGIFADWSGSTVVVASGSRIDGGKAPHGGGIFAGDAKIELSGSISNSHSGYGGWGGNGGGIYLGGFAGLKMSGGASIAGCSAGINGNSDNGDAGMGGAIYLQSTASASIANATLSNNAATYYGGAVFTTNYSGLSTDATVSFSGNTARFYRVPADTVIDDRGVYPCTTAGSISVSGGDFDGRMSPLNNYDISYFSYKVTYKPNGATNTSDAYSVHTEIPFSYLNESGAKVYTMLDNPNPKFTFEKEGSKFALWANAEVYAPVAGAGWFTALEPGDGIELYSWDFKSDTYPERVYSALWQKEIVVTSQVAGDFVDKTKKYTVTVSSHEVWTAEGQPPALISSQTYTLDGGQSSGVFTFYDDSTVTIEEDVSSLSSNYTVSHQLDGKPAEEGSIWSGKIAGVPADGSFPIRHAFTFANEYRNPPVTGVEDEFPALAFALGAGVLIALVAGASYLRKRFRG